MVKLKSQKRYSNTLGKRSYKPRNIRRSLPLKKIAAPLVVALIFGGIFYFLFFSEHFKIKTIEVDGIKTIHKEDIVFAVKFVLSQKELIVLPQENLLLMSEGKLKASILDSFPKISTLEIKKINPDGLSIVIFEREVIGIWCGDECFYFDDTGTVFERSPKSIGSLILSIIDRRSGQYDLGDVVLKSEQVEFFKSTKDLVDNNFSFAIKNFIVEESGNVELQTSFGWKILLDKDATSEFQLSNLKYILDEEIKTRVNELEYVDLRLGNRVYYKYRDY